MVAWTRRPRWPIDLRRLAVYQPMTIHSTSAWIFGFTDSSNCADRLAFLARLTFDGFRRAEVAEFLFKQFKLSIDPITEWSGGGAFEQQVFA